MQGDSPEETGSGWQFQAVYSYLSEWMGSERAALID